MSSEVSAFFNSVEEFVTFSGGDHAIKKILIANNGIGATKAIRSIRKWAFETFGNERMIEFVVMATPQDMAANAEYIRLADEVVDVPGGSNNNNYANVTLICEIAASKRVDAVMPMWGHASENPNLPTSIGKLSHKCTFIGPPAAPMQALGDKIGSTIIAQSAGVPVIGWNGDDLRVNYQEEGIPQSVYDAANVITAEDALACCERIGYPVMIKASEGGGGKGIRKVLRSEDVLSLYRQVQGEIPGSPIFVMKMASKARHLEVQLLADKYGEAIALSGRDCSVQRRHQKIIEEGPPTTASKEVFKKMERAAVALAKTVGYCNAGTVEYLFLEEDSSFAFLELNPRLQVEHPVTENILNLNLPSCQLMVAMGIPLHRIMGIRKLYGYDPRGTDVINFDEAERQAPPRHCIAVRVTAENPEAGFQPTSGKINEVTFRSAIDVWGYFSVDSSGNIHEFADSQFGHIFAGGPTREHARKAMITALKELSIRGDIRTTTEYIIKMLQSDDFINDKINTDWLDGRIARHKALSIEENAKYAPTATLVATCGAALQSFRHFEAQGKEFVDMLQIGQVGSKEMLSPFVAIDLIFNDVKFKTNCVQNGPNNVIVHCNGDQQDIGIRRLADGGFLLNVLGKSHLIYASDETGGSLRMILDGTTCMFTPEYDPTRLASAVAGKLARLLVPDGSHLEKGDAYVEVEVMKMYMPLKAEEAGTISFQMSEGATLSPGDVIALMTLDDPDKVVKAEEFSGTLSPATSSVSECYQPHLIKRIAMEKIERVLSGYAVSSTEIDLAFDQYTASFSDKLVPALEIEEAMSPLRGRIDANLSATILTANSEYKASLEGPFPAAVIVNALNEFSATLPVATQAAFHTQTAAVRAIATEHLFSTEIRILAAFKSFLVSYLTVEKYFDDMSYVDVVASLKKEYNGDLLKVLSLCRSHLSIASKNSLVIKVMEHIRTFNLPTIVQMKPAVDVDVSSKMDINTLKIVLADLTKLKHLACSRVSLTANLIISEQYSATVDSRKKAMHDAITSALSSGDPVGQGDRVGHIKKFIDSNIVIRDLLLESLANGKDYQIAIMEMYVRKVYRKTHILSEMSGGFSLSEDPDHASPWIQFNFSTRNVEVVQGESSSTPGHKRAKSLSYSDLVGLIQNTNNDKMASPPRSRGNLEGVRTGIFVKIDSLTELEVVLPSILRKLASDDSGVEPQHALHILIAEGLDVDASDDDTSATFGAFLSSKAAQLRSKSVNRVTFMVWKSQKRVVAHDLSVAAVLFTFRAIGGFGEDRLHRYIEAPHAYHIGLNRLSNFSIDLVNNAQTSSGNVHLYKAVPKNGKGPQRYFARLISFASDLENDIESLFVEALDEVGIVVGRDKAAGGEKYKSAASNHVYVNAIAPDSVISPEFFEEAIRRISNKYWYKMVHVAISTIELKLTCKLSEESDPVSIYFIASNPTGFVLKMDKYFESFDQETQKTVFKSVDFPGPLEGLPTDSPYQVAQRYEQQRADAMTSSDTLYVYDWPVLFERAVEIEWATSSKPEDMPMELFSCQELVICDMQGVALEAGWSAAEAEANGQLLPIGREPGSNDCGMVAWLVTMCTPEYPKGRDVVLISNDITFMAGSFGTKEDIIFYKASEYARKHGIPRIFLAANSGARIGMAQSLKSLFKVCWTDENDPSRGFKYIYLAKASYDSLLARFNGDIAALPVICTPLSTPSGEERYVISDIIGEEPDLGVENLMGSGLIAGETSKAYDDIFTLTLVVGRTVGIGAYLVRLGQRTIQKTRNSPIILTGYQALNKLMGREIYTTNDQLGGPMIMYPNGVSHLLAETHFDSVMQAVSWLSFVSERKGGSLPVRGTLDTIDRTVQFSPKKGLAYDPRLLLTGEESFGSDWASGFFDRSSFIESLGGWAKTVIVGRGRLGGIPIGVIVTENRTAEALKPADPADNKSAEKLVQQAGGVWFPDSAYKTAQALRDFNREGLPCIVFANWRGFSGGQRDMFDEVLKFGSMIVDALVAYQQPLFVYIPPFAELRGGAWVVVDSTINSDVMEFYAAEDARGGVLEAAGAASIKFRDRDIVATAHRLDDGLKALDVALAEAKKSNIEAVAGIEAQIKKREKMLFGVFQQVAVHFADLHDTPGRMKSKGVIRQQVTWAHSRSFFYWRLRRRLAEFDMSNKVAAVSGSAPEKGCRKEFTAAFQDWFLSAGGGDVTTWENDKLMTEWFESNEAKVSAYVDGKRASLLGAQISGKLGELATCDGADALKQALSGLTKEQRSLLLQSLCLD